MPAAPLRIIIADDCDHFRNGMALFLSREGIEVAATVANGAELLETLKQVSIDVVLLDIRMPVMGGIEACRQVKALYPETGIIASSIYETCQPDIKEILKAGANAFLSKNASLDKFRQYIYGVAAGDSYYSEVCRPVVNELFAGEEKLPEFTERERQLVQYIYDGLSSRQIGATLHLSPFTVDKLREKLFKKCGVKSKEELIKYAMKHGLVKW